METPQLVTGNAYGKAAKIKPHCPAGRILTVRLGFEGNNEVYVAAAKLGADLKGKIIYDSLDAYACKLSNRYTSEASKQDSNGRKTGPPKLTLPEDLDTILDLVQSKLIIKMAKDGSIFWQCQLPPGHDYQLVVATSGSSCRVKLLTATMGGAGAQ